MGTCTGLMYRQYLRELTLLSELKKEQSPTNCPIKSASIVDLIMGEPAPLSNDKVAEICKEPPAETKDFFFQQTMFRIKDPSLSLDFYNRILGMRLLKKFDFPSMKFSLYFMGYCDPKDDPIPDDDNENCVYHCGNTEPRGFGHIGIVVPDVEKACERFEKEGVPFIKKPNDGKMKGLAFIKDPDGYWIEILNPSNMGKIV